MWMRITDVITTTCVIPLEQKGLSISNRLLQERHFTIVRIKTDVGIDGIGFTYCGNLGGRIVTLAIQELLKSLIIGRDPHQVEDIWDSMYKQSLLHGRRGSVLRAISAIDIALWDVISKNAGLPLYKYLGEYHKNTVPAYASGGYYATNKGPDELAEEMNRYKEMGFTAMKMKLGRLSPKDDALRVKAAREAIGEESLLFLDANNAYQNSTNAIEAIKLFEAHNPGWIEEPLMPDDIRGHAEVAEVVKTPVATGEIHATRWDFQLLIDYKSASILQPDVGVCGGVTEIQRISSLACKYNIPIAPHWLAEVHAHIVASNPNAIWVEYFTDFDIINLGKLFKNRLEVDAGRIKLPQIPGLGIELDEKSINQYSIE